VIIKFCLVFPKIFLLHKVVRDAKKVEKHWCKVPCFQRGPTATVIYKWAILLSNGPPTAVVICKYLVFKGAQSNCNA